MNVNRTLLPMAAATMSGVLMGLSFVAIRFVMEQTSPATLATLRYGLAALCLLPFCLHGIGRLGRADLWRMALLGAFQFGIFQWLVNSGLQHIPASRGAVIFSLIPLLTMSLSALRGQERFTALKLLAAVMSVVGVSLALGEKAFADSAGGGGNWTGELMFFGAVMCGATYNAFSPGLLARHGAAAVSTVAMASGVALLLPLAAVEGIAEGVASLRPSGWGAVAFLGIGGGALSFVLFNWSLRRLSPLRTAIFVPLAPIVATAAGAWLLGETVSLLFGLGLAGVVAGIWLASWRGRSS
ncbi:MAG TPA: DMT family transporter [Alphaproteobacteria bacterium]|nr:DMT family transporter [Alphaproteobacteria bacterium]MDP6270565.1 DMT family transporter [Alphaproteobacteria bacterium]HJM49900.1 DMT family transporter [Alphaproteobacteria bacterium]